MYYMYIVLYDFEYVLKFIILNNLEIINTIITVFNK